MRKKTKNEKKTKKKIKNTAFVPNKVLKVLQISILIIS